MKLKSKTLVKDAIILAIAIIILLIDYFLPISSYVVWNIKEFVLLFIVPAAIIYFSKYKLSSFGLNISNFKHSVIYAVVIVIITLPILVYISGNPSMQDYYPVWENQSNLLTGETLTLFSFFGLEFFFRGFLLNLTLRHANWKYAVILTTIPYVLIHIGKPFPELVLSFFAGIVFGYVAYKTKSIMPSLMSHYTIAVILDCLTM
jgi:membrane protease YdiL (CAAX protease family)